MELKTYYNIIIRRWWVILLVLLIIGGAAVYVSRLVPPKYQAETSLRAVTPLGGSISDVSFQVAYADRLINTYADIASSDQVMNEVKAKLGLTKLPDITIKTVPNSEILVVTVNSTDPALAAKTANTLASIVIEKGQAAESQGSLNSEGINILTQRQDQLQKELAQERQDYAGLIDSYAQTNSQLAVLDSQIRNKEASYQNLETQYRQAAIAEATQLYAFQKTAAKTTKDMLSADMAQANGDLVSLRRQYQALSTDASTYSQKLNAAMQSIQSKENGLTNLQSQIDSAKVANSKLATTRDLMVASPADVPTKPTIPVTLLIIGLGILIGLIAGILLAFLLNNMDNRIYTVGQIQQVTDLPIVGRLPNLGKKDRAAPLASKDAGVQTAFWSLCTKILTFQQTQPLKTIVISSPNPAEGKSTVLMGVAMGLARSNRKVLVVDADLRIPRQHELLHAPGGPGFGQFLSGEKSFDEVVQRVEEPSIDFIPGGNTPDDPAGLFQSRRFATLMEKIADYDFVLFDSAALLAVPDTYNLAMHMDGILLIVQRKRTTTEDLQMVLNQMKGIQGKLLGVIVNHDKLGKVSNYYQRRSKKAEPVASQPVQLSGSVK